MARILKLMNASMSYTWSAEFMAGTWNRTPESRVSLDHMRFMARGALANGCKAISWFMFHDRESWGDSPVSEHGHPRPSLQVLREIRQMAFEKIRDWDSLTPVTDVAVVYDLLQHVHTSLGDPMPCADNSLHIGGPTIDGVQAGEASAEYAGLYRVIEQTGIQAGAVDVMHDASLLRNYPLAFLPGSPVIEESASAALGEYVATGGVLVVSGPWPTLNEYGKKFQFLSIEEPAVDKDVVEIILGEGKVVWHRDYLAQEAAEEECPHNVKWVAEQIAARCVQPAVRLSVDEKVSWTMTQNTTVQGRNLGSAVLHSGDKETVLYVSNLYPAAARFTATFGDVSITRLEDLFTGAFIEVTDGKAALDIDRKSCSVYRAV